MTEFLGNRAVRESVKVKPVKVLVARHNQCSYSMLDPVSAWMYLSEDGQTTSAQNQVYSA